MNKTGRQKFSNGNVTKNVKMEYMGGRKKK